MSALVTIVIPTHRRPALLERAVRSVLAQTSPSFTILICDNASGDDTASVAARLGVDPRVRYLCHAENIGAAANYNSGLSRVVTPFFCLLGDDDVLLPDFLRTALGLLESEKSAMFFAGRSAVLDERADVVTHRNRGWRRGLYAGGAESAAAMVTDHFINIATVYRTAVLETVGFYDVLGSDRNYIVCAAALHPFFAVEEEVAVMAVHGGSFSGGSTATEFVAGESKAWGSAYVAESHRLLLRTLSGLNALTVDGIRSVRLRLERRTLMDMLYVCLRQAPPGELRRALAAASGYRDTLPRGGSQLLSILGAMPERLARFVGLLAARSRRKVDAGDEALRHYVREGLQRNPTEHA